MYKIILADDEGLVIDSLTFIIERNFGESCEVRTAKTGRLAIELAEDFGPDIIVMDIHMPGINGIDAMKEIRKSNKNVVFIVMTAYDQFDFAKESINLGVLDYLTKPAKRNKIVDTLERAMRAVDKEKQKRNKDLETKEKLDTALPVIENSMIYTLLFKESYKDDMNLFKSFLNISTDYGYFIVIQFGDMDQKGNLTNLVGASIKAQGFYTEFCMIAKEFFQCLIGPVMADRIVLLVPWQNEEMKYEERIQGIEMMRNMILTLMKRIDLSFRAGIGNVKQFTELTESYKEAITALDTDGQKVVHSKDIPKKSDYDGDYPEDIEDRLFKRIDKGDVSGVRAEGELFFGWMINNYADFKEDIQLKVLEFVLRAERIAFQKGKMTYGFLYRKGYLGKILSARDYEELKLWFLDKLSNVCRLIVSKEESDYNEIIRKARAYIRQNFNKDLSLEEVSKEVDISPYYFSKLFKEETGINFIDFLTRIRMEKAKELLANPKLSMKEICIDIGYSEPNYFSRIFKKCEGMTPTEYREGEIR